MEPPILVDSNVFITLIKSGEDPALWLSARYDTTDLATCGMVRLEVLRGIRMRKVLERVSAFFDVLQFVQSDLKLWNEAAVLGRLLADKGITIPGPDLVIAAAARRIGAVVLTADKHFTHVPGLRVLNP